MFSRGVKTMPEKKSLVRAMEEAQQMSIKQPSVAFRVMDKPRKKAVVNSSDWVYRELVLDGWHNYCTFRDGKMI